MADQDQKSPRKPRVVFDPKMPVYEYRDSGSFSLSVDRKRAPLKDLPVDTLAHLKVG